MEITIGHVLAILVIVSMTALIVSFVLVYKESLIKKYENSAMKKITTDIAHTLTTSYVEGHESEYVPDLNEKVILVRSNMILPQKIGQSYYSIKINNSEKMVCSYIKEKEVCSPIIGPPLDFNITSNEIGTKKTLNISYWRENNNTIIDYIIID